MCLLAHSQTGSNDGVLNRIPCMFYGKQRAFSLSPVSLNLHTAISFFVKNNNRESIAMQWKGEYQTDH